MSMIAIALVKTTISQSTASQAKEILRKILFPQPLQVETIVKYMRKAFRLGIWHRLKPEQKALLRAVTKTLKIIKNPTLHTLITQILVEIELATIRGKALLLGVVYVLKEKTQILTQIIRNLSTLLVYGLQILNHPMMSHATNTSSL